MAGGDIVTWACSFQHEPEVVIPSHVPHVLGTPTRKPCFILGTLLKAQKHQLSMNIMHKTPMLLKLPGSGLR